MVQLDMDMPTRCFDCLIEQADDYTMSYECPLVYKGYTGEIRMTGRLAECPLRDVQPVGENEKMSDLISRQAAIDAICEDGTRLERQGQYSMTMAERKQRDADILEALPSVQPERKTGKWIYGEDEYGVDGYRCDECGFFVLWDYAHNFINYIEDYKYCPNCGADMRGEADED